MLKAPTEKAFCLGVLAACVAVNLALSSVGWRNLLLEFHVSRQAQTALIARCLEREGWQPAYPLPLFGPPWSAPFEFPFYEYATAKFAGLTGLTIESAGRTMGLVFLYLSLPALALMLEPLGVPAPRRWLLPGLVLLSPAYLYYSRALMIESTALCASAWFLVAFQRGLLRPAWGWVGAAAALGTIAGLAKITTWAVFLSAAALYTAVLGFQQRRRKAPVRDTLLLLARALLSVLPALVAAVAWIRFTDAVKDSNPLASVLSSASIHEFNFGTLAQRCSPGFWRAIADHSFVAVLPPVNGALLVLFGLLLTRGRRWVVLGLAGCYLAGPLAFANLYFVHDYYFYAGGVFLLAALVVAWSQLLELDAFPVGARRATIALSLALQVFSYTQTYFRMQWHPQAQVPELAGILARCTAPQDIVLVFGQDWNPTLAYYADRRAVMVVDRLFARRQALDEVLDRIAPGRVTALVATGAVRGDPAFFRPLIRKLDLHPDPVFISGDSQVYLARVILPPALSRIAEMPLKDFAQVVPAGDASAPVPRMRHFVAALRQPELWVMMKPTPVEVIHPFELGGCDIDGRRAFNAHAPTDLIFQLPPAAREVAIEFGILPGAYTGGNFTDGVEFRVELVATDGRRQVLHRVYLDPYRRPLDRGTQRQVVPLPAGATGDLWCRTLPGPAGSIACDWAYWTKIDIH